MNSLQVDGVSAKLRATISELKTYFDEEELVSSWQNYLDVINCAGIPDDILNGNVYICPAEGGAYSHGRAKYFGMYRKKRVEKVALIEAVVDVYSNKEARILWNNHGKPSEQIVKTAHQK